MRQLLSSVNFDTTYGRGFFGEDGIALATNASLAYAGRGDAVQADGKLLVAAQQGISGDVNFTITRLNTNGYIDTTYGVNGTATAPFTESTLENYNVVLALQGDGKALLTGTATDALGRVTTAFVERFTTSGAADASFGTDGVVNLTSLTGLTAVTSLAVDSGGQILVGGDHRPSEFGAEDPMVIARLLPDGSLDDTFGSSGISSIDVTGGAYATTLVQDSDGSWLVGAELNGDAAMLVHLSASGILDTNFGKGGFVDTGFDQETPLVILPAADGGIFVGSDVNHAAGIKEFTATGAPDYTFNYGSAASVGYDAADVLALHENADGSIVSTGFGNSSTVYVAKLTASGQYDVSYNDGSNAVSEYLAPVGPPDYLGNCGAVFSADGSAYVIGYLPGVFAVRFSEAFSTGPTTGSVAGVVSGGAAGETVYLDANNNGVLDSGEMSTTTASDGAYTFSAVPAGLYVVRQQIPGGFTQTLPTADAGIAVTITNGTNLSNVNFTDAATPVGGSVSGVVTGGPGGETVFLDANNNGTLDSGEVSTTTSSTGAFSFTGVPTGAYVLRQVLGGGYTQTSPSGNTGIAITVVAGAALTGESFVDAAPAAGGSISGVVTNGLAGETIYLDTNNNSKLDATELWTTLTSTGSYSFINVPVGATIIRQVLPSGYTQTSPSGGLGIHVSVTSGGTLTGENFTDKPPVVVTTGSVSGTVTGGPAGETLFLDANNNGLLDPGELSTTTSSAGAFSFASVSVGSYVLRQVLGGGYTQASPAAGAGIALSVTAGGSLTNENFIDTAPASSGGSVSGTVTGSVAGELVYLDANNNSKLDTGELSTTTTSTGSYSFTGVPAGAYIIRQVLPSGYTQTSPSGGLGIHVTVTPTSKLTNENFTDKASAAVHTKLTGTTIGTAGSYNNSGNTIAKATDGSTSTYFDGQAGSGNWVGYDLGSAVSITQIAYAPRSGYASRLTGGQIQISTTADFSSGVTTIYTITAAPASSLTTITLSSPVTARYIRYLSPAASHGDISEFEVFS